MKLRRQRERYSHLSGMRLHPIKVVPRKSPFRPYRMEWAFFLLSERHIDVKWGFILKKTRVVIKIGSSSLTNAHGEIDTEKFNDHIEAIAYLKKQGHEVAVVSSGAVAAGFRMLGYPARPLTLKGKQAAAALGQGLLIQQYRERLAEHGFTPAQILLTRNDFSKKERYRNAYATLTELLHRGIVPVINENDTVSVTELTFGDNDMLSALVSGLLQADQLVILTDVNGFYTENPFHNPNAERIDYLPSISPEMMKFAEGSGSKVGTGGMASKLSAAQTAISLGVKVFIGTGKGKEKIVDIIEGKGDGTYIGEEALQTVKQTKQWISLHSEPAGKIYIDDGAALAMTVGGASLLQAGIVKVEGRFEQDEVVEVWGPNGVVGRGEVLCSSDLLEKMIHTGYTGEAGQTSVVIHRNRWVALF